MQVIIVFRLSSKLNFSKETSQQMRPFGFSVLEVIQQSPQPSTSSRDTTSRATGLTVAQPRRALQELKTCLEQTSSRHESLSLYEEPSMGAEEYPDS
ncbi:uncharacterized protein ColSpa_08084 [Colletotrichum spaethianum]|uniref:Uncharacterized protein n=1 Tax=Colletotrichum spaethianum TaxID=700344 RepID=A0AA37P926_9PEZI|nr:uncharacterized protein ColSpa_08084 [Colletotrichum spaethianum]GKT47903.1 hypothetical protein ColSpa_08084 [Colletotrichum spaethianum]